MHTAVITGSTGGIGMEISKLLAAQGWNLVLLNRSLDKTEKQTAALSEWYPDQSFYSYQANMMDLSEVDHAINLIGNNHPELSALYNVAGLLTDSRMTSMQGVEAHFAVNTLAPYLMIQRLRSQLSAGSSSEQKAIVVNFSSSAIKSVKKLDISSLINPKEIGGLMGAYAKSKVATTMISELLQEQLSAQGILICSVDPGPTKTPMTDSGDGMPWFLSLLQPLIFKSAEAQAGKVVDAVGAVVHEGVSGVFISEGKRKPAPAIVSDTELQSSLRALLEAQVERFL
ncbi:MAG: SDR family NAD(P)-dependent oxidoreductase [Verrucomicrobiota bacterium]